MQRRAVGRDGEHDLHVDRGVARDEVGERPAPGLLDGGAASGRDELVGEPVDRCPRPGGVLAGKRAEPRIHPRLGHPAAQTRRCPGSRGSLPQEVRGDTRQEPARAAAECRGVVVEVRVERRHDRIRDVGRRELELVRDDARAVAVEATFGHCGVDAVQPVDLGDPPAVGLHRRTTGCKSYRQLDPPLRLPVRGAQHRRRHVRRVEGDPAVAVDGLAERAVLAPGALASGDLGERGVLYGSERVDQCLAAARHGEPLVTVARAALLGE